MRGYYFITDALSSRAGNVSDVRSAVAAGVEIVQYRNKTASTNELYKEALILRQICKNKIFIINDRVDIALSVNADGVNLGQDDLSCSIGRKLLGVEKVIGVTVHSVRQALEAQNSGADYIAVSPIFKTATKRDAGKPVGVELISEIKKRIRIPVVAIGGITLDNAEEVITAGADCLCAISGVVAKRNVKNEIKKFQKLF